MLASLELSGKVSGLPLNPPPFHFEEVQTSFIPPLAKGDTGGFYSVSWNPAVKAIQLSLELCYI